MKKDRDKYLFDSPKRRAELEREANREEYVVAEPTGFSEFTDLVSNGNATEQHHEEFTLRLIEQFMDSVYAGKTPDGWVMHALADSFMKVVNGGRWEDEFPLPWTKISLPHTAAEWQALGIFCDVTNVIKSSPGAEVTAVIREVASARNVSYESARAAYYKHKHLI
jgi:hypothetical protein